MKAGLLGYCLDQKTKDVELKVLIISLSVLLNGVSASVVLLMAIRHVYRQRSTVASSSDS